MWDVGVDRGLLPQRLRYCDLQPLAPVVVEELFAAKGATRNETLEQLHGEDFVTAVVLAVQRHVSKHAHPL